MDRLRTLTSISVFWIGLSVVGDAFLSIVVVSAVAAAAPPELTATTVGLMTFVGIAIGIVLQPFAGAASDAGRPFWGRRGQIVFGAVLLAVALVAFGASSGLVALTIAFICIQVAATIAQAAQQGLIPDIVEPAWRGRAGGAKGFADLAGAFLGFSLLAALLASGAGLGQATGVLAAVVIGTAVAAAVLVRERTAETPASFRDAVVPSVRAAMRRAFSVDVPERSTFARVVVARFLFLLATFTVGRYLLLIVGERLELDAASAASVTATVFAILTLVTAVASIPAGWVADRTGRVGVMIAGAVISGLGSIGLLAAPDQTFMLLAGGLLAVGSAAFATASWAWTTDLVAPGAAGRHMGLANIGAAGAAAVAGLLGPLIDASRTIWPTLGFSAALIPAVVLFGLSALCARSAATPGRTPSMAGRKAALPHTSLPHPEVPNQ